MYRDARTKLQAPPEGFRVVGVDTFDGDDWIQGDFSTLEEAAAVAKEKGGEMTKMYIYNDKNECLGEYGTY